MDPMHVLKFFAVALRLILMAPFRRGKSGPKKGLAPTRGRPVVGRSDPRNGASGSSEFNPAPSNPFKASRINEVVKSDAEQSDILPEASGSDLDSERISAHASSSESDVGSEKPYSVLLQALNPSTSRGEPKRKRRRLKPPEAPVSVQAVPLSESDVPEEAKDEDDTLEDDAASSGVDDITQSESSKITGCHGTH